LQKNKQQILSNFLCDKSFASKKCGIEYGANFLIHRNTDRKQHYAIKDSLEEIIIALKSSHSQQSVALNKYLKQRSMVIGIFSNSKPCMCYVCLRLMEIDSLYYN